MEDKYIKESRFEGLIYAPPSKSMTIRALACALLAEGTSVLKNISFCDDALVCLSVINALGAKIERKGDAIEIQGTGGLRAPLKNTYLYCGESGLCARMFIPIVALRKEEIVIDGSSSLLRRPFHMVEELEKFHALCRTNNGYLPVKVKGRLRGVRAKLDGSITSQFLTGLLFALPLTEGKSEIYAQNLKSKPYILMTLEILEASSIRISYKEDLSFFEMKGSQEIRPIEYTIEGDWSSAAFFLVAGAIKGSVRVRGLNLRSNQADKRIIEILRMQGAKVVERENEVFVEGGELKGFDFDLEDSPDLFPPLVVLASASAGKSTFYGIERLKYKESDRLKVLCNILSKLGIRLNLSSSRLEIYGGKIGGGVFDPEGDHRIAMALGIAGLRSREGIKILNTSCVRKSYPNFFEELEKCIVLEDFSG